MDVWLSNVLNFTLFHRIGYQFCDPVCAYGGNSKLVSGITSSRVQFDPPQPPQTRRKPTKIEVPKWASSDNNRNCEKEGSNTKSSAPQPPPPPPPPAPSAGLAINANVSHPLLVKNQLLARKWSLILSLVLRYPQSFRDRVLPRLGQGWQDTLTYKSKKILH